MTHSSLPRLIAAFSLFVFVAGCKPLPPAPESPAPPNTSARPPIPADTQTLSRDPKSDQAIKAFLASSATRAAQKETEGVMKASEYEALMRIATYTQNTKKMTDADVDFVAKMLRCGPLRVGAVNQNSFRIWTMTPLVGASKITPAQKEKIVAAVAPLCEDPAKEYLADVAPGVPSSEVSVQRYALGILRHCDTPKAKEICARLSQNSATERVRRDAESNLRRWQEKA